MSALISDDIALTTKTLTVDKTFRIDKDNGAIKCENGQWYLFEDFLNDWNDDGLYLPSAGLRIRIQLDKFNKPVNWRQWS